MLAWNIIVLGSVVVLLGVAVGYWLLRRRGDDIPLDERMPATARPAVLVLTRFGATAAAGIAAVTALALVLQTLTAQAVSVTIPVQTFWPGVYPWVQIQQGPTATVTGGGFSSATVDIEGLDAGTRVLLAGGHLLQGATVAVLAAAVAVLCHRLLANEPFRPIVARSFIVGAVALMVGGIGWQICFETAGYQAAEQALLITAWSSEQISVAGSTLGPDTGIGGVPFGTFDPLTTGLPQPTMDASIEFWPIFLGLALLAVAAAFRQSERMQRDTVGLV
ncbi:hypothetical protein [Microterricola viridarii]|uniref:Uncharacterized protein n=1 Tax=Microterricola viridarii TaxID=412690 RepID=A0A1H1PEF5_9MICO|nr:hypothetical protein [Microterricola viridarii]SDS09622.1 hypothetical protein SAMN04489834_0854 [Microterricola viridarii]